jgi:hypothetical protein
MPTQQPQSLLSAAPMLTFQFYYDIDRCLESIPRTAKKWTSCHFDRREKS